MAADDELDVDLKDMDNGSEEQEVEGASGGEEQPDEGAAPEVASAKTQKKSPKVGIADGSGKGRKKVSNGKKFCPAHNKMEPIENFPQGSGQCGEGRKIVQNLRNAAKAQDQMPWFESIARDPKKLAKAVHAYQVRCPPPPPNKRRASFATLKYVEEVKQEQAVIYDGILEMMSLPHFVCWMGKPKNGSMDPLQAASQWKAKFDEEGATTDKLGANAKHKDRVAIKKTDVIKLRDQHRKSTGYQLLSKEQKNPSAETIDKAEVIMQTGPHYEAASSRSQMDMARAMAGATAVS